MRRHRIRFLTGVVIVVCVGIVAVLATVLATHHPLISSLETVRTPSATHWLGTDELGRDIYSRLLFGTRTSLLIGVGAAVFAMLVGVPVGLVAGYWRGRVDLVSVQAIDVFIALPGLVLALMITAIVGASIANLAIILGIVAWPEVARLVRGQVLGVRETAFIQAAEALGGSPPWIVWKHVWPNIMTIVAAQFSIAVSSAILTSASLSFLGLGIGPPTPDWGAMVRGGFDYLAINPMMSLAPGASVALVAVGFYLLGSAID